MNAQRAKDLRRTVYQGLSQRARQYHQRKDGSIINVGLRGEYRTLKRKERAR